MTGFIGIIVGLLLIGIAVLSMWKKIKPGTAGVVTGIRQRVIINGGGLVICFLERIDKVSLQAINIEIVTTGALSANKVPLNTTASVIVKIANNKEAILAAMENFGGDLVKIEEQVKDLLTGKIREILGTLTIEELYENRDALSQKVLTIVATELTSMGLELKTLTIKDIRDDNGYIDSLGQKELSRVKRDAHIAIKENERDEQIKTSEAKKLGEEARLQAETAIAEAEKIKAIKQLTFKREQETATAESDAAYAIQENITRKQVTDTQADAELIYQERQKEIEAQKIQIQIVVEQKNIELAQKRAERKAQELQETIIKPAEAEKEKQQLEADAVKYKEIADAQAVAEQTRLQALAEAESIRLRSIAEAEALRIKGQAEAETIKLKTQAEAEGLSQRADALSKLGAAGKLEMIVPVLPAMAQHISSSMSQIDKIVIMDGGNGDGHGGPVALAKYAAGTMGVVMDSVKEITGIDISEVIKANTYDAKVNKNINISGDMREIANEVVTTKEELTPVTLENTAIVVVEDTVSNQ